MKNKHLKKPSVWIWYALAIVSVFLAAPNSTIIKTVVETVDPAWVNVMRFAVVAIAMAPFMIRAIPAMTSKNVGYALAAGAFYAVAVTSYVTAISLSQASYVAVIDLGIPVVLMVYSVYLTREKVSRKAVVGISIAALGAFTVIGFPLLAGHGFASDFHPMATVLALANVLSFPMTVILSRKASEQGLSLGATFGLSSLVIFVVSVTLALVTVGPMPVDALVGQPGVMVAIVYSALAVSLLARLLTVAAYKHLGSAAISGLHYIESFASIMIPIILLGEVMTREMMIGGLLILIGVLVAEVRYHPTIHHHHRAGHRHV